MGLSPMQISGRAILALALAIVLVAGCSDGGDSTTSHAEASVSGDGVSVTLNDFNVSGPAEVGQGSVLSVDDDVPEDQAVLPEEVSWLNPISPTVKILLDGDQQPGAPVRLKYRLPNGVRPPAGAVPIVVSRSADGGVDMAEARVEDNAIIADLSHLSWDVFAWFRPDELNSELTEIVKPILGTGSPKPDCVGKPLTYPNLIKSVSAVEDDVAWTCISNTPGTNRIEPSTSIGLTINSPFAWQISAEPRALNVVYTNSDAQNSYLRAQYDDMVGTGEVAGPGDTVRMDFGQYDQGPRTGTLTRDPKLDAIALTAWAYEEALERALPKVFGALDLGPELFKCAGTRTDAGLGAWGADIKACAQGLGGAAVRLVIGKTGVLFGAYIADVAGKSPTTVSWTVTDQTKQAVPPTTRGGRNAVLGRADNQYAVGYGTARPTTISLNSLCANTISAITWTSWGGPQASGTGQMCAPAASPDSGGSVQLTATDLGDCYGTQAYRKLLIDGQAGWNICQ